MIEGPFHIGTNQRWGTNGSYSLYAEVRGGVILKWQGSGSNGMDITYDLYQHHDLPHPTAKLWVRYHGEIMYMTKGNWASWLHHEQADDYIRLHGKRDEENHFL